MQRERGGWITTKSRQFHSSPHWFRHRWVVAAASSLSDDRIIRHQVSERPVLAGDWLWVADNPAPWRPAVRLPFRDCRFERSRSDCPHCVEDRNLQRVPAESQAPSRTVSAADTRPYRLILLRAFLRDAAR